MSDGWFIKTRSNGTMEWNQPYIGSGDDNINSVIQTADGGFALLGSTNSTGAGYYDIWLTKVNSTGQTDWNKTYGNATSDFGGQIIQTSDGGFLLTGYYFSSYNILKVDSQGQKLWNKSLPCWINSLQNITNNGYILVGTEQNQLCLVKIDSNATIEWNKTYSDIHSGNSVYPSDDGGYLIGGNTLGSNKLDMQLVKTDDNGTVQWKKSFGGVIDDGCNSAIQTSDGGFVLAGFSNSFGLGFSDFWLVKTNSTGHEEWNYTIGGDSNDNAIKVLEISNEEFVLAGNTVSFGSGRQDAWLVKIKNIVETTPTSSTTTSTSTKASSSISSTESKTSPSFETILTLITFSVITIRKRFKIKQK